MARTGRPRQFNREEAITAAMMLFWEYGFDSTSLAELKKAMGGISSASFYAAFESKDALFEEVLARYLATFGQVSAHLTNSALAPRTAIELTLRSSAQMQTGETHPLGCLVVQSASTCSPGNAHIAPPYMRTQTNRPANLARSVWCVYIHILFNIALRRFIHLGCVFVNPVPGHAQPFHRAAISDLLKPLSEPLENSIRERI